MTSNAARPAQSASGHLGRLATDPYNLLILIAFGFSFVVFLGWIAAPVLDFYGFRQAQTAISAFYLAKEGFTFAYPTPVLGAPWALPFEFPVYQFIIAALKLAGIPLDVAGRIVSYAFFVACLWPLYRLSKDLKLAPRAFQITAILWFSSPIYVFWSRTVMIESTALFFSLLWLALLVRFMGRIGPDHLLGRRGGRALGGFVVGLGVILVPGILAVLTKGTTFPAFCVAGCLLAIGPWPDEPSAISSSFKAWFRTVAVRLGAALIVCLVPIAIGQLWVNYSDHLKELNRFADFLTIEHLRTWNFGTIAQRLSERLWIDVIGERSTLEAVGYGVVLLPVLLGAALTVRRSVWLLVVLFAAFLTPFLTFTNLHIVHNYYQYANAVFLVLIVSVVISTIEANYLKFFGVLLTAVFLAGNGWAFSKMFLPLLQQDWSNNETLQIASEIRSHVPEGDGILVIGRDWSSELPYYAERKALMIAGWFPPEKVDAALDDPQAAFGDVPFGGVVVCGTIESYRPELRARIEAFLKDRRTIAEAGTCRILSSEVQGQ